MGGWTLISRLARGEGSCSHRKGGRGWKERNGQEGGWGGGVGEEEEWEDKAGGGSTTKVLIGRTVGGERGRANKRRRCDESVSWWEYGSGSVGETKGEWERESRWDRGTGLKEEGAAVCPRPPRRGCKTDNKTRALRPHRPPPPCPTRARPCCASASSAAGRHAATRRP